MASTQETGSYKYQWSRHLLRTRLEKDFEAVKAQLGRKDEQGVPRGPLQIPGQLTDLAQLIEATESFTNGGLTLPPGSKLGHFKVGIVGAGVAGLFSALLFDWINDKVPGIHVEYDILEAAKDASRLGGRLFTWHFKKGKNPKRDYYDVGAMRFPQNSIMQRTFRLFEYIELDNKLIDYYMQDYLNVCPAYFNNKHTAGDIYGEGGTGANVYDLNKGFDNNDKIRQDVLDQSPDDTLNTALDGFLSRAKKGLDKQKALSRTNAEKADGNEFWELMMAADMMSTRQFLNSTKNPDPIPAGPEFNFNTIEWLETSTVGSGWFDQALTETILEELDFTVPKTGDKKIDNDPKNNKWRCLEGGTQQVAVAMAGKARKEVEYGRRVTAIRSNVDPAKPQENVDMTVTMQHHKDSGEIVAEKRNYFVVFNSTTFGAAQRMDLADAGLHWGTKQAIRSLGYSASCKVGMLFSRPWWRDYGITLGGVSKTDLPLRVCVYPSYNVTDPDDQPAVLLCSYTWAQDAQRMASLISRQTPEGEEELIRLLLHDLARLHAPDDSQFQATLDKITPLLIEHHAWDWYHDPNMAGAFAYFGPGDFSNMWPHIVKPNSYNQLYFIGEATSAHHAWIVGAIESAVRAAYLVFASLYAGSRRGGKEGYEPYHDAMKKLSDPPEGELPENYKPFYPLPDDVPKHTFGVDRNADVVDTPAQAVKEGKGMSYPASLAALSMVQSVLELSDLLAEK